MKCATCQRLSSRAPINACQRIDQWPNEVSPVINSQTANGKTNFQGINSIRFRSDSKIIHCGGTGAIWGFVPYFLFSCQSLFALLNGSLFFPRIYSDRPEVNINIPGAGPILPKKTYISNKKYQI